MTYRFVTTLLLLSTLSLTGGCAGTEKAYQGETRASNEVATINTFTRVIEFRVLPVNKITRLKSIDATEIKVPWGTHFVTVLPGKHSLGFVYKEEKHGLLSILFLDAKFMPKPIDGVMTFSAEAGHAYELHSRRFGNQLKSWIVDKSSNKVVAGEKPDDVD